MKRLVLYAKKYYIHIVIAAFASGITSIVNVELIDILKRMIDLTLEAKIHKNVSEMILHMCIMIGIGLMVNYLVVKMTGYFGAGILRDLRKDSINHLMKVSPDILEKNDFGDMMERLSSDIEDLAGYTQNYLKDCIYVPIVVVVLGIYLIRMNVILAIICLLPLVFLVPVSTKLLKPIKLSQAEYVKLLGYTNNHIQEAIDGVEVVKAYNLQRTMEEKYQKALDKTFELANTNDLNQYRIEPLSAMIRELPITMTLCVGGCFVFQGEMSFGMLVAFLTAVQKINEPLVRAYQLIIRTQMAMVSVKRVFDVMDMPEERQGEKEQIKKEGKDIITFRNVTFSYQNKVEALKNFNLVIPQNAKIAIVGKSGCGKSTLLKLIARQYELEQGELYYYKKQYALISPMSIRAEMALISQDAVIFPISVSDNIRIGKPDATVEEIRNAARMAGCDEFIQKMKDGYDSILEERGENLSGGQKQRIAIARAILKDANVLLMDEPTAALDQETQLQICKTVEEVGKNKTIITVAHRLSTIEKYDDIIVMESGEIVERGTHAKLLEMRGSYYQLYQEYVENGGVG